MRASVILGILLVILGVAVFISGGSFATRRTVLQVGGISVSADERQSLPVWACGLIIAGGLLLVVSGARRRRG